MNTRNILIIGNLHGSNRSEYIVEAIDKSEHLTSQYLSKLELFRSARANYYGYYITGLFLLDLIKAYRADAIVFLPMNDRYIFLLVCVWLINKNIVVDFYTSRYFINGSQRSVSRKNNSAISRVLGWINDYVRLRVAKHLIFLQSRHQNILPGRYGIDLQRTRVSLLPLVAKDQYEPERRRNNHDTDFNICWWGKASHLHGLNYVVSELEDVCAELLSVKVHFFDPNRERLRFITSILSPFSELGKRCSLNHELTMKSGLADYLQESCDLALGTFSISGDAKIGIANKTVEAWSLALPIVTLRTDDLVDLETGYYIKDPEKGALASIIRNLVLYDSHDGKNLQDVRAAARVHYQQLHRPDFFMRSFETILTDK